MARAEGGGDGEDVRRRGARAQRAEIRLLDRGAIGHRIGEGHAELDHIRAALDQSVEIGRSVAVTSGDEADERGVAWRRRMERRVIRYLFFDHQYSRFADGMRNMPSPSCECHPVTSIRAL